MLYESFALLIHAFNHKILKPISVISPILVYVAIFVYLCYTNLAILCSYLTLIPPFKFVFNAKYFTLQYFIITYLFHIISYFLIEIKNKKPSTFQNIFPHFYQSSLRVVLFHI